MGWENRDYYRDGRGRVMRRIFGDGENPLDWSLPLYRAWGISVRVHLIFVIMIIARMIYSLSYDRWGPVFMAISMGSLFGLVLLHEYGHCIACRRVGGTADRILMWPLGGLAYCSPPHNWRDNLITTLGGPMVNVLLMPVLGLPLVALSGWDAVVFNPVRPDIAMVGVRLSDGSLPYWLVVLWSLYYSNLILLAFNMLVPMYPMDAGRVLQEILWWRMGEHRSLKIAVNVGLVVAVIMFVASVTFPDSGTLMALALFGGITCWIEKRRLAFVERESFAGYEFRPETEREAHEARRRAKEGEARRKRAAADQAELDRLLDKIKATGMGSLNRAEKAWLERTSKERRGG
jgi:Zn-dependent protease